MSILNNFSILGFVIFSMIGYMANEKNIDVADATADGKIKSSIFRFSSSTLHLVATIIFVMSININSHLVMAYRIHW